MLKVKNSGQFRKDYKKCSRRGFNMNLLKSVVAILAVPAALPQKTQGRTTALPRFSHLSSVFPSFFAKISITIAVAIRNPAKNTDGFATHFQK